MNPLSTNTNLRTLFVALFVLGALATATVGVVHAQTAGEASTSLPDVVPPQVGDAPNDAELEDLQAVASQEGISLQDAIDRYGWNDNFALAVSGIRETAPAVFAGAEIVDDRNAWIAFVGSPPQSARSLIDTFSSNHSGVSVEVRTNAGFTEEELEIGIEAVHFAVLAASEVRDASTSFDYTTGQISTTVVLESTVTDSALDNLRAITAADLKNATRSDILDSLSVTVTESVHSVLSVSEDSAKHLGGEALSRCTSGFGTKKSSGVRGIATAGHCPNSLTDDGADLTFEKEHEGKHGDFQWHTGTQTHEDDFYAGSTSSSEVNKRDVSSIGDPTVGQTLCRNGNLSNRSCQQVRKINYCTGDLCNLVQMGSHLSDRGDSGGPVYWVNTAYGIHYGKVYDPWPFTREAFSRADRIDNALGVYIATN